MQAYASNWTPPGGVLGGLVAEAEARARALWPRLREIEAAAENAPPRPSFVEALTLDAVSVIAEVKRRSPSKGAINVSLSAAEQAGAYARGGAAAISVLTEPAHFGGDISDLEAAADAVALPLLRKDFIVSPLQLAEARAARASAALLIARALPPGRLAELADAARTWGVEPLIEVRSEDELLAALDSGARVVGVNNRDLETLAIDASVGERMIARIPRDCFAVYESGIQGRDDVLRAARVGADAVLVGSSVSGAHDPAGAVRALAGVPKDRDVRRY